MRFAELSAFVGVVLCVVTISADGGEDGPVPCTEEAIQRGVSFYVAGALQVWGRGVAFADLDGDGDADIVALGRTSGQVGIFQNFGTGQFTDVSDVTGIPPLPWASGVIAGDYDGDRDLDLYISNWAVPNTLLRNDGGFSFVDVSVAAGVDDGGPGVGCAWGDYDGDCRLDLYVSNRSGDANLETPNRLYRNLGNGTFEEVAVALGVDDGVSPTFQVAFFDYDHDADADIYLTTDKGYFGETNRLFENLGGTFADVTEASGTGAHVEAMGLAVGDFSGNGHQDLYITNTPLGHVLLINDGEGAFVDESVDAGVQCFQGGWGAVFYDFDNDGHQELYAANSNAPNCFYDHDGTFPATDIAELVGMAGDDASYSVATADVDLDGDLDLMVGDIDRVRLYINHEGERRSWVKLDVRGTGDNHFAIGANVSTLAGGVWRLREVTAGNNYKAQNELTLHYGLGDATVLDQINVTWPGGDTRTLTGLPAMTTWTLYHLSLLFDTDQDGQVALEDFNAFSACGGPLTPGCEMMDGDGDADVDGDDLSGLLAAYQGPLHDCNGDGVVDLAEIFEGSVADTNANGIPDDCEQGGDVDGDGHVNLQDLIIVIVGWGPCPGSPCLGDADLDGAVTTQDLLAVIVGWD